MTDKFSWLKEVSPVLTLLLSDITTKVKMFDYLNTNAHFCLLNRPLTLLEVFKYSHTAYLGINEVDSRYDK